MSPVREFDWGFEIGMYGITAAGALAFIFLICGLLWMAWSFFERRRFLRHERHER